MTFFGTKKERDSRIALIERLRAVGATVDDEGSARLKVKMDKDLFMVTTLEWSSGELTIHPLGPVDEKGGYFSFQIRESKFWNQLTQICSEIRRRYTSLPQ